MTKNLICLVFVISYLFAYGQAQKVIYYENGKKHIVYNKKNGLLQGKYISYYPNGKKKTEGSYINNQKSGKWLVWDSTGKLRIERFFHNPYYAPVIHAWNEKGKKVSVQNPEQNKHQTYDTKTGFYPYYPLSEKEVAWSKSLWHTLLPDSTLNQHIFGQNCFINVILENVKSGVISAYKDDKFNHTLPYDSILFLSNYKINKITLKEDLIYNKAINLFETRILGICITGYHSENVNKSFWLYMPEIRELLASCKLPQMISPDITNLENVFSMKYFNSTLYKYANINDLPIEKLHSNNSDITQTAEILEMELLDTEFDFWLKYIFQD